MSIVVLTVSRLRDVASAMPLQIAEICCHVGIAVTENSGT